jgi:hypothetical protein
MTNLVMEQLFELFKQRKAGTFKIFEDVGLIEQDFKDGYIVGLGERYQSTFADLRDYASWVIAQDKPLRGDLMSFNEFNLLVNVLPLQHGIYVGTWVYDGVYYVEFSARFVHKVDAVRRGKANNQRAIFDCKIKTDIML